MASKIIEYVDKGWLPVYEMICEYCEAEVNVTVVEPDEQPNYCPMCGEENVVLQE